MKQYLSDLRHALRKTNLTAFEIEDIIKDHQEMIETALAEGLNESEIPAKFGTVEQVVQGLNLEMKSDTKTDDAQKNGDYILWKTYTAPENKLNLAVHVTAESMTYLIGEHDMVRVYSTQANMEDYVIDLTSDTLSIKAPKKSGFGFFNISKDAPKIMIQLPKELVINALSHQSVSGDTMINPIKTDTLHLKTISGDTKLKGSHIKKADIQSVSGDFNLDALQVDAMKINIISGDLHCQKSQFKSLDVRTVSGDVEINDGRSETCIFKTVSGDMKASDFYPNEIQLKSVSGDIKITNSQEHDIKIVSKKTLSGEITIKP